MMSNTATLSDEIIDEESKSSVKLIKEIPPEEIILEEFIAEVTATTTNGDTS
jgi:hypothetical protein